MDPGRFEELKDAYVLGALPDDEPREFEEYLAEHPERRAEVDELGRVANVLALSPWEQEPSRALRRNVMQAVEAESERPRRARRNPVLGGLREFFNLRNFALGAAALLVIGLFSWNMLLRGELEDLQGRVQNLQDRPQAPAQAPVTVELAGTWAEQGAQVEALTVDSDRMVLVAEKVPQVPEDKTCQIWVIKDGEPKPSGLFEPDGEMVATAITSPVHEADVIAVTVEPDGGSPKPTTEPTLVAEL